MREKGEVPSELVAKWNASFGKRQIWTGQWPGQAEARALGWFSIFVPYPSPVFGLPLGLGNQYLKGLQKLHQI